MGRIIHQAKKSPFLTLRVLISSSRKRKRIVHPIVDKGSLGLEFVDEINRAVHELRCLLYRYRRGFVSSANEIDGDVGKR
jgi:hypothetical protein